MHVFNSYETHKETKPAKSGELWSHIICHQSKRFDVVLLQMFDFFVCKQSSTTRYTKKAMPKTFLRAIAIGVVIGCSQSPVPEHFEFFVPNIRLRLWSLIFFIWTWFIKCRQCWICILGETRCLMLTYRNVETR